VTNIMSNIYLVNSPEHIGSIDTQMSDIVAGEIESLRTLTISKLGANATDGSVYSSQDVAAVKLAAQIARKIGRSVRLVDALTPNNSLDKLVGPVYAMEELYTAKEYCEKLERLKLALEQEIAQTELPIICVTHEMVIQRMVGEGLADNMVIIDLHRTNESFAQIAV
jgi:hypothetical protein